jgi:hypothetical protein
MARHLPTRLPTEQVMFLIFPHSMIIPEALERLEDSNFEDWLTAAVIEKASQPPPEEQRRNGSHPLSSGITDLWMLEIAERTGKIWTGTFQVELNKKGGEPVQETWLEHHGNELSFALDTQTAEITFQPVGMQLNSTVRGSNRDRLQM